MTQCSSLLATELGDGPLLGELGNGPLLGELDDDDRLIPEKKKKYFSVTDKYHS